MYRVTFYVLTGTIATGLHTLIALSGTFFGLNQSISNGIASLSASIVAHQLNARLTFKAQPNWANYRKYLMVSSLGFFYSIGIGAIGDAYARPAWQAIVFIASTLPLFTYSLHKFWTFKS